MSAYISQKERSLPELMFVTLDTSRGCPCFCPQLCRLQAELTRLRSTAERGEAQRVELQYQLTVSQRDAERACQLSRDKHTLTG